MDLECRYARSCTAVHSRVESSKDKDMIPFAVPFLRKSASLTLLMKASCSTLSSPSSRTSCSSGHSVKCKVNRHGNGPYFAADVLWSSGSGSRSGSGPGDCEGAAPENRS